jgi:hypothetical protein
VVVAKTLSDSGDKQENTVLRPLSKMPATHFVCTGKMIVFAFTVYHDDNWFTEDLYIETHVLQTQSYL